MIILNLAIRLLGWGEAMPALNITDTNHSFQEFLLRNKLQSLFQRGHLYVIFGNDKIVVETGGLGFRVILKVYRLGDQEFQAVLDHMKLS